MDPLTKPINNALVARNVIGISAVEIVALVRKVRRPMWYFVYEAGVALAAFPERDLAVWYSEGTDWEIKKQRIDIQP